MVVGDLENALSPPCELMIPSTLVPPLQLIAMTGSSARPVPDWMDDGPRWRIACSALWPLTFEKSHRPFMHLAQ